MDTQALQLVAQEQLSALRGHTASDIANERTFASVRLYAHPLRLCSGNLNLIGETRI